MKIAFDLDDTLCMTDEYSEYYITKFIKEHNLPFKKVREISRFSDGKYDWSMDEAQRWFKAYGDAMMLEFPCKPDGAEIINKLHSMGYEIVIITARATDWHNEPERISREWLKNNKIEYDEIYFGVTNKQTLCKEIGVDYIVDDDLTITENFSKLFADDSNKCAFLMSSEYNKTIPEPAGVIRINSLQELFENLMLMQNK